MRDDPDSSLNVRASDHLARLSPAPFFASLQAIRRFAIGAALIAIFFSQVGGHIGVLEVDHLRWFELTGVAAALWVVLLIVVPWERWPIAGLSEMSMSASLIVLAMVSLSGGTESPAWIYYVVIAVFNALYFPPRIAYALLGVTIAALIVPAVVSGDGSGTLLQSIITLPVYIALTMLAAGISADVRAAERHRCDSAIARARLGDADRWADRLEAIQEIGGRLHRVTSVPDLGDALLRHTRRVVPFDRGRFAISGGDRMLDLAVLGDGTLQGTVQPFGRRSEATVAIVYEGHRLGRMVLERGADRPFTAADRRLLSIVATFAASAVANAQLFEQARYDAERDGLTGLFNRRAGLAKLGEAIARTRTDGRPFAACMLDLDGFKACNDRFGHPAGDDVLREVAQRLSLACRDDDVVARYGGDEFLVILAGVDAGDASAMCLRLRNAVAGTPVTPAPGHRLTVDVSAGIAVYPLDGETPGALIAAADHALYAAKRSAPLVHTARPGASGGDPVLPDATGELQVLAG